MKMILALAFILLAQISRAAETSGAFKIANSEEFLALTAEDQIEYLRKLRNILAELDGNSPAFASLSESYMKWMLSSAEAAETNDQHIEGLMRSGPATDTTVQNQNFDAVAKSVAKFEEIYRSGVPMNEPQMQPLKNAFTIYVGGIRTAVQAKDMAKANQLRSEMNQLFARMRTWQRLDDSSVQMIDDLRNTGERIIRGEGVSYGVKPEIDPGVDRKTKTQAKIQKPSPRTTTDSTPLSASGRPWVSSTKNSPYNPQSVSKGLTAPAKQKAGAPAAASPKAETKPAETTDAKTDFSGCVFAGFVLTTKSCDPPRQLPESFKLQETFDVNLFKCSKNEIICNPLLFGFEGVCPDDKLSPTCVNSAKPVCTFISSKATIQCRDKTTDPKYLKLAAAFIRLNPKVWDKFGADFKLICDPAKIDKNSTVYYNAKGTKRANPEEIKDDILKTCEVARPRLEELNKELKVGVKNTGPVEKPGAKDKAKQ